MEKNLMAWPYFLTFLLLTMMLLGGCSKKEDREIVLDGNTAKIDVFVESVDDIEEEAEDVLLKAAPSTAKLNNGREILKKENAALGTGFVSSDHVEAKLSIEEEGKLPLLKASSGMAKDNTFRVLLYKKSDGSFYSSTQLKIGTTGSMDVAQNETYTWYAYSYNDQKDVPDVADKVNPALASVVDRDLLYANGEIAVGKGDKGVVVKVPLKINFRHMTSRIGVVLNAQGMFAGINSGTLQIDQSFFEVATLNLKTGIMGTSTASGSGLVTSTVNKQLKPAMADTAKIAYFYTSSSGKVLNNFKVTVTGFELLLDDASRRLFSSLNTVFAFPTVTPVLGKGKLLKIDLIESALTIGKTKWARANLYWTGNTSAYVFRHFPDNRYKNLGGEFWDYGTAKAGQVKPNILFGFVPEIDPCAFVYPKGVWRMPTETESLDLVRVAGVPNGGGNTTKANGTTFGPDYIEYTATGTGAPYPSNRLRISFKGVAMGGGQEPSRGEGGLAQFWNSSFFNNRFAATVYNAGNVKFIFGTGLFKNGFGVGMNQPDSDEAATGYVLQAGVNSAFPGSPNIRCVRSSSAIIIE